MLARALLIFIAPAFAPLSIGSPLQSAQSQFIFLPTGLDGISDFGGPPSTTRFLDFTNPGNGLSATASGTADLVDQGLRLGAGSKLFLTNASPGQYSVRSLVNYEDFLTFANAPVGSLSVRFTYHLDGAFLNSNGAFAEQVQIKGGLGSTIKVVEGPATASVNQDFSFTDVVAITADSRSNRFDYFVFLQTFVAASGLAGPTGQTATGFAEFASTLHLTNVEIFNAGSGAPLPNVIALNSDGGFLLASAGVPEPGTQGLAFTGLALLLFAGIHKGRSRAPAFERG